MLIPIVYTNGKHDLVKNFLLSQLIDDKRILKFRRSNGWVSISENNILRSEERPFYDGPKSRLQDSASSELMEIF